MTERNLDKSKIPLSHVMERLQSIQKRYALSAIQHHLNACASLIEDRNTVDVGILGRFKAGKSSFLNLLANKSVLPVGVIPVTAVITRICYGPSERAEVFYEDGRTQHIPVESVKLFVSEPENPKNVKKVASVIVELPSLRAYRGLQFVDTPGLESVYQHDTDTTLDWLPNVGLALITVSVDTPLSKHDVELIRVLCRYTPRIVVLLTKADLVSEGERKEIAAFVQDELRREFGLEFRIIPFSVRQTHEHFRKAFDKEVLLPLVEVLDSAYGEIVDFKFNSLLGYTRDYLSLALAVADRADADRSQLKTQVLNEKTSFESIRMELQALATECAGQTRPWIMKRMKELKVDLQRSLNQELHEKLSGLKANLWNLSRAFEQWLQEAMTREMREISARDGDLFTIPLERARDTLSRAVGGFRDRLAGNIEQALGMQFQAHPFKIEIQKPSTPTVAISNLFMFNTDLLWFVIPMSIFRSWADRHFLSRIPYETEKNLSRLASQWTEKINSAILAMQRNAEQYVRDQLLTIESLLSQTHSEACEIRISLSEVESLAKTGVCVEYSRV
jgi:GTP-binding protein EngB required for normal cell division